MKGLDNSTYLLLYIISNAISLLILGLSWKTQRAARLLLFLIFVWASWTNWNEAIVAPLFYLNYGHLTFSELYRRFIIGWFSTHITQAVGLIATCQALIAFSILLKGWMFKTGAAGAIIFLLAIAPLGVGSAFPCTLILAISFWLLTRNKKLEYLWISKTRILRRENDLLILGPPRH